VRVTKGAIGCEKLAFFWLGERILGSTRAVQEEGFPPAPKQRRAAEYVREGPATPELRLVVFQLQTWLFPPARRIDRR
jgi:hypothetical protein